MDNLWQGKFEDHIEVIGDKSGGKTTMNLDGPIDIMHVHVMRYRVCSFCIASRWAVVCMCVCACSAWEMACVYERAMAKEVSGSGGGGGVRGSMAWPMAQVTETMSSPLGPLPQVHPGGPTRREVGSLASQTLCLFSQSGTTLKLMD